MRYSKKIVALVILLNCLYAAAVLFVFYHTGVEPTTLTISWFAFTTSELLALAGIRIRKEKKNNE